MSDLSYSISDAINVGMQDFDREEQIEQYKASVEQLADKIVAYSQSQNPVSAQMVEILIPFLEVAVIMEGIIETMTELASVIKLVGDAISILDSTMKSSQEIIQSTNNVKYTWLRRLKRKIMMRRAKANNRARAKEISDNIVDYYEMATELGAAFKDVPASMNRAMEKIKGRRNRKGNDPATPYAMSPDLRAMLEKRGAKFDNLGYTADGTAPATKSNTPTSGEGGGYSEGL